MGSTSRNPRIVHFGDCVLDLDTAELRRNGTKTSLQSQPFQILTALLENPGQLVTREELTKKLWPDGTFVDFDQSLNKAVARLREALGDNAEQPVYIETLARRGYRWKTAVQWKRPMSPEVDSSPLLPDDPDAYEAYAKGRYFWNRRRGSEIGKAIQYFQQAVVADPSYAPAYAGFADCMCVLGFWGYLSPDEGCGRAKWLAFQALERDRCLAEGHASLAFAAMSYDYDFEVAEREFKESIALNTKNATAHLWFGLFLGCMGRFEEGLTKARRAIRLEPYSLTAHLVMAMVYFCSHRYDDMISQCGKALELEPDFAQAHFALGLAYAGKSRGEAAIDALQRAVERSRDSSMFLAALGGAYATSKQLHDALAIQERLHQMAKQQYISPYMLSRLHLALGETDEALHWLENGYRERAALMVFLKTDPQFDPLRSDQRFERLLHRMKFPP